VNSEIFEKLGEESFFSKRDGQTWFDEKKSILYIKGEKVKINKQDKTTNSHKILRHIFVTNKNAVDDDFFYSEIAEDEFNELDYKNRKNNWERYRRACMHVNKKVEECTKEHLKKFLIFNTGKKGKVKVNKKYL